MTSSRYPTPVLARGLHLVGLLMAAAGITTLFITDSVDSPVIWVGPIVFVIAAVLNVIWPRRWTLSVGVGFSLFVLVGAMIAPGLGDRLRNPGNVDAFLGTTTQISGLLLALGAGVAGLAFAAGRQASNGRTTDRSTAGHA